MSATNPDAGGSRELASADRSGAARAFKAVFRGFEPYGRPFKASVPARLLAYEAEPWKAKPWGLNDGALVALLQAADDHDLERVFVSVDDPEDSSFDEGHYLLSPLNLENYTHPGPTDAWPILPHAIYPPSGQWGVISSDESHVLVGGSEKFIDDLSAGLGKTQDEMIAAWLEDWSEHQDRDPDGELRIGDWIPAQLAHVVGPERAEVTLGASRLRRWDLPT
jgi:hypothetical protein